MIQTEEIDFETAFQRLEQILEKMHAGALALEESLRLYEEADALIKLCNQKLQQAEAKMEMLVKNKEGEIVITETGTPLTQPLSFTSATLSRSN